MRERPIRMSAPMVRAILARTKSQTRRVKTAPPNSYRFANDGEFNPPPCPGPHDAGYWINSDDERVNCPYGASGARLWVRETFSYTHNDAQGFADTGEVLYWADGNPQDGDWSKLCPSIHMPRWASRITLEITGVRVERLQEISEADCVAEGTPCYVCGKHMDGRSEDDCHCFHRRAHSSDYRTLWESINGRGSWDANPYVWALTFRRIGDA